MATKTGVEMWRGQIRVPKQLMDVFKSKADSNFRSLNSEIVELMRNAVKNEASKNAAQ